MYQSGQCRREASGGVEDACGFRHVRSFRLAWGIEWSIWHAGEEYHRPFIHSPVLKPDVGDARGNLGKVAHNPVRPRNIRLGGVCRASFDVTGLRLLESLEQAAAYRYASSGSERQCVQQACDVIPFLGHVRLASYISMCGSLGRDIRLACFSK
jgi:hypothetical protein